MKFRTCRSTYPGPPFLSFEICFTRGGVAIIVGLGRTDYMIQVFRDDA